MSTLRVADEVWIATALLHREHADRADFTIEEILERAETECVTGARVRPGVRVHAVQHCVAGKNPNPGRYRMLTETGRGRRRLYRAGDTCHPGRSGKTMPIEDEIPAAYRELLDWYRAAYLGATDHRDVDPILSLRGTGREIWSDESADKYVGRLREDWT